MEIMNFQLCANMYRSLTLVRKARVTYCFKTQLIFQQCITFCIFCFVLKISHFENVVVLHIHPDHAGHFFKVLLSTLD